MIDEKRWQRFNFYQQMGNIASEISRAINFKKKNDVRQMDASLLRLLELVDLTIEDHPYPLKESRRLLNLHTAYNHMDKGDLAIELGQMEKARKEYGAAQKMFPENLEMKFWYGVALVNAGKVDDALPIFKTVFSKDKNWATLIPRLSKSKLLPTNKKILDKIMAQKK